MERMENAVEVKNLSIGYRLKKRHWKVVHDSLSFVLKSGELTSLIGLNGAGKSTLIRTLCRFQDRISGNIEIFGKEAEEYSALEFSRKVGVVLTERTNVAGMTVRGIVSLGRQPHTGFFGSLSNDDRNIVDAAMESVGIIHKADSYIHELSDGERQRTMIAKAIAQECPVIILDEPTAFLDVASRMDIMELLHRMAAGHDKSVFLSTHDIDNAIMYSDKLMLLASGEEARVGTPEDLVLDGSLGRFFMKSGMNFDVRSGRLSSGVEGTRVGVSGDGILARWMSNALARNGFTPCLPSGCLTNVTCLDGQPITVSYADDGNTLVFGTITEAVKNILEHNLLQAPGERWRPGP